jgi:hypothetical protein
VHYGPVDLTASVLSEQVVEIVPLLASRDAQELIARTLPRADRVALSQLLLC